MKNNKKYIFGIGLLILIFLLTYRLLFSGQEFSEVIKDVHQASNGWLLLGAAASVLFVACESCIIYYMLRVMKQKRSFFSCLKYSFIGFFYSYITPSSSGGQPAQMYYMKKDGIKIGSSALIMILITVAYKSTLLIFGAVFFYFINDIILSQTAGIFWLIIIGAVLNTAFIALLIITMRKPESVRKFGIKTVYFLYTKRIIKEKNYYPIRDKICRICDNYRMSARYLRNNQKHIIIVFLITAIQRIFLFSITWIVYRSYGLNEIYFLDIIALQTTIAIAVEMLPLPGAAGITEGCFFIVFESIFTSDLVRPALIISRGLSFYLILILGGLVTLVSHVCGMMKQKNYN